MKYILPFLLFLLISCSTKEEQKKTLFVLNDSDNGMSFENALIYDEAFNPYVYRNFYNGGGVAIGDVNNDGLEDIYFTGNMVDNKLFLNKGNWKFEDITAKAGVSCSNVWSSGAIFADINGDGLLDLYVCKAGKPGGENRHNELFINNGDLTFTECSRQFGLDITGLSVHAAFFDYDKDGDLDAYLLNNSIKSIGAFDLIKDQRLIPNTSGSGNKFLRNDSGKFIDITEEAGIFSSKIGFGLGITLGDFNDDNWTDIFISNDFFEKDYLYINDRKGGFSEQIEEYFQSISMGSMGADLADLDNDLKTDLMVTEMLPETDERQKTKTIFESWDKHQLAVKQGYYNQFSRNTLQRNLGNGNFIELGRQANVSATEWSWSTLLFDMDNDGYKDIFVSNGIYKDLLDRDYLTYEANDETIRSRINSSEKEVIKKLIDAMPSKAVPNAVFRNLGGFNFENKSKDWGLDKPSFSNGSAYVDLDNDGDLDIVVNNVNMPSFIYENKTDTLKHRSVTLKFVQKDKNVFGIGTKATIQYANNKKSYGENYNSRGFQSSVANGLHFGVGDSEYIDSLFITWPNGKTLTMSNLRTNETYSIEQPKVLDSIHEVKVKKLEKQILEEISPLFDFAHEENSYIDFNKERLLTQMYSNEGPCIAVGDINNDNSMDYFVGGAKNQSGALFISSAFGFSEITKPFIDDINSEDTDAVFFDGDNDGDLDLYVCHGGRAFSQYSIALNDSYYINNNGTFEKLPKAISFPKTISSSVVKPADYDNDGDLDLFVGERYKTNLYGKPCSGYLLENDGNGNFKYMKNDTMENIGMIKNASWVDIIKHDKRNAERQQAKDNYPGDEVVIKQVAAYMKHMDDPRQAYQQMAIDYPHMGRAERSGLLAKAQEIAFPEVTEMKRLAGINESNPKRERAAQMLHDLVEPDLDNFSSRDELESYMSNNMPEFYRGRDTGKAIEDAIELLSPNHKIPEAEYQGKKVELSKPKRGGSKKFYVYVKDPKTKNIKKVSFGADSGGGKLAVKLKDPKARKAFADRHNCDQKKDKTKAGYWSCRLPRYAKSLGLSGGGTWW